MRTSAPWVTWLEVGSKLGVVRADGMKQTEWSQRGTFFYLGDISADLSCWTASPRHFPCQGRVPVVPSNPSAERQGTGGEEMTEDEEKVRERKRKWVGRRCK